MNKKIIELTKQQELWGQVISKAWEDESFKQELINNPVEAIEKLTGKKIELPEGKTLVVRDQTDESTIYINIPTKADTDVELSEDQLEAVAGGIIDPGDGSGCTGGGLSWPPKSVKISS